MSVEVSRLQHLLVAKDEKLIENAGTIAALKLENEQLRRDLEAARENADALRLQLAQTAGALGAAKTNAKKKETQA